MGEMVAEQAKRKMGRVEGVKITGPLKEVLAGDLRRVLEDQWQRGYRGFVSIEPHMALTPFIGRHKGQPCIYAPQMPPEGAEPGAPGTTVVLAMDGGSRLATLPYEVEGAGDGWMIRVVEAEMDRPLVKGKGADWIRSRFPRIRE
jgi:alkyl sulfatase BDS1-like metallo-beta-lactamase superfamily hydrolase